MSKSNKSKDRKKRRSKSRDKPEVREVKLQELKAIIERAKSLLSEQDVEQLQAAVDTLAFLTQQLEKKGVSIKRLRQLIFGVSSEKTREVFKDDKVENQQSESAACGNDNAEGQSKSGEREKPKRKGHGRRAAEQYRGAQKVKVAHQELKSGDMCPACERGKLYPQSEPAKLDASCWVPLEGFCSRLLRFPSSFSRLCLAHDVIGSPPPVEFLFTSQPYNSTLPVLARRLYLLITRARLTSWLVKHSSIVVWFGERRRSGTKR